jgi:hypothetical protein
MYAKMTRTALIGVLALVAAGPLSAQDDVARKNLARAEALFSEPFSRIAGLRELADGRVMISDRLEQAVRIIDFANSEVVEVGHVGQGPGEYRMPGDLLALPGDRVSTGCLATSWRCRETRRCWWTWATCG